MTFFNDFRLNFVLLSETSSSVYNEKYLNARKKYNELLKAGVTVRCQYEYTAAELQDIDSYIGFPFVILKDGKFKEEYLNQEKVNSLEKVITNNDLTDNSLIIQKGKKVFIKIIFK